MSVLTSILTSTLALLSYPALAESHMQGVPSRRGAQLQERWLLAACRAGLWLMKGLLLFARVKMGATTVPRRTVLPGAPRKVGAWAMASLPTPSRTCPPGTCASCWAFRCDGGAGGGWGWVEVSRLFSWLIGVKPEFGGASPPLGMNGTVGWISVNSGCPDQVLSTDCHPCAHSYTVPLEGKMGRKSAGAGAK